MLRSKPVPPKQKLWPFPIWDRCPIHNKRSTFSEHTKMHITNLWLTVCYTDRQSGFGRSTSHHLELEWQPHKRHWSESVGCNAAETWQHIRVTAERVCSCPSEACMYAYVYVCMCFVHHRIHEEEGIFCSSLNHIAWRVSRNSTSVQIWCHTHIHTLYLYDCMSLRTTKLIEYETHVCLSQQLNLLNTNPMSGKNYIRCLARDA
jgi:hypothetical protein